MRQKEMIDDREYFKSNKVVCFLRTMCADIDLNKLWNLTDSGVLSKEDMKEFYQLIGYSVEGYKEIFNE